jgi:hypothetical protein
MSAAVGTAGVPADQKTQPNEARKTLVVVFKGVERRFSLIVPMRGLQKLDVGPDRLREIVVMVEFPSNWSHLKESHHFFQNLSSHLNQIRSL